MCVCVCVCVEEYISRLQSFVKDDGTLFTIFNLIFSRLFLIFGRLKNKMLQIIKTVNSTLPLKTTKNMVESATVEDVGQFLYHLDPDARKITRILKKIKLKIIKCSIVYKKKLA